MTVTWLQNFDDQGISGFNCKGESSLCSMNGQRAFPDLENECQYQNERGYRKKQWAETIKGYDEDRTKDIVTLEV